MINLEDQSLADPGTAGTFTTSPLLRLLLILSLSGLLLRSLGLSARVYLLFVVFTLGLRLNFIFLVDSLSTGLQSWNIYSRVRRHAGDCGGSGAGGGQFVDLLEVGEEWRR